MSARASIIKRLGGPPQWDPFNPNTQKRHISPTNPKNLFFKREIPDRHQRWILFIFLLGNGISPGLCKDFFHEKGWRNAKFLAAFDYLVTKFFKNPGNYSYWHVDSQRWSKQPYHDSDENRYKITIRDPLQLKRERERWRQQENIRAMDAYYDDERKNKPKRKFKRPRF